MAKAEKLITRTFSVWTVEATGIGYGDDSVPYVAKERAEIPAIEPSEMRSTMQEILRKRAQQNGKKPMDIATVQKISERSELRGMSEAEFLFRSRVLPPRQTAQEAHETAQETAQEAQETAQETAQEAQETAQETVQDSENAGK